MSRLGFTKWELAIVLTIVVTLVLALVGWPEPNRPVSREQIGQIRLGMSEEEVMQILGPPSKTFDLEEMSRALKADMRGWRWRSGKRKLEVYMNDGRVVGTVVVGYPSRPISYADDPLEAPK